MNIPKERESELRAAAQILKATPLFVDTAELDRLTDKQHLFLAIAGVKPVSQAASGHWIAEPGGRRTVADDPRQVAALLGQLGLSFVLSAEPYATIALVSRSQASIGALRRARERDDTAEVGRLFGYPESAALAFAAGARYAQEQEEAATRSGLPSPPFVLSAEHWRQELEVWRSWHELLGRYGLADEAPSR